jgi:acetylornithine deacetylase/succinyl-diaminopimelate desuccinylase-like protein
MMKKESTAMPIEIDDDYTISVVGSLISHHSVSGKEDGISRWTAGELRRLGLEVVELEVLPGRANVIATLDSGRPGPILLFNGHLDTLPVKPGWTQDPFQMRRVGDKLVGAEINNMKAAVAGMIGCMAAMSRAKEKMAGKIVLSAVIGECDALGLGTTHMLRQGLKADMAINGEPTDLNVMTAHSGVSQLRLTVQGRPVHVCQRAEGRNAIEDLVGILAVLDEKALRFTPHPDFPGLPTMNVGVVRGGAMASMLAEKAEAMIDVRTVPGMTPEGVRADLEKALASIKGRDGHKVEARIELLEAPQFCQQLPYHVTPEVPVVEAVADSHESILGRPAKIGSLFPQVFYGTDASHLLHAGIPTVIYGPGKVADINVPDESMAVADFLAAARVYLMSASRICARH